MYVYRKPYPGGSSFTLPLNSDFHQPRVKILSGTVGNGSNVEAFSFFPTIFSMDNVSTMDNGYVGEQPVAQKEYCVGY